ncbi:VOC family protein [Celeribacter sp.]|uniref:VOC family protein n=1 Tax=Celeribacter sp. TaxID=1890673 RepID=UPI003A91448C
MTLKNTENVQGVACALDHLVMATEDLAAGRAHAQALLDVSLTERGVHEVMGTHNHLASLDRGAYFEVIARDPDATPPEFPRWFDLDNFSGPPRLTNWVINTPDLEVALALAPADMGRIMEFERGPYAWRMVVPETGVLPFDGCFPAIIEWHSEHPAPALPQHGFTLRRLKLAHPQADALRSALAPFVLGRENVGIVQAARPAIQAEIGTPSGEVWIS